MLARARVVSRFIKDIIPEKIEDKQLSPERGEHIDNPSGRRVDVKIKLHNIGQVKK